METLVVGALLLAILLSLVPLLARARLVVEAGGRTAWLGQVTSAAIEERVGTGFREAGAAGPVRAYYSRSRRAWLPRRPPPPDLVLWRRLLEVRRYPPRALEDGRLDPAEALAPGDAPPGPLLWEVEVRVDGGAAVLAGGGRRASLRLARAF